MLAAWRLLDREQRTAALAALGLFVTMLLPWYTKTNTIVVHNAAKSTQTTLNAFEAFSFVEGAVLLVSLFVLCVLFFRAERRAFHLPGGDGLIILLAGVWAAALIFYRMLDKPALHNTDVITATEGITWGIFIALLVALALAYAGVRLRASGRPEPPLLADERPRPSQPDEREVTTVAAGRFGDADRGGPSTSRRARTDTPDAGDRSAGRPRYPPSPADDATRRSARILTREDAAQLSFEDPSVEEPYGGEPPVRRPRGRD